jgi:hypothetical protein
MVEDVCIKFIEAYRLLIGNKMDLVAFVGQRFSQLCGEHATSAECGVTDNAYTHKDR